MTDKNKFLPGTVIRFQGLISCSQMNNNYGVVKSQLDDGNLRLQINSKNDMAVKPQFCKPIVQCMNRRQRNVPVLIHPKLKGEYFPRVHWLHEAPKDIFPKSAFDVLPHFYLRNREYISAYSKEPNMLVGKDNSDKTIDYLKGTLNWKNPTLLAFTVLPQKCFIIWYDKDSTAKINDVINTHVNSVDYHDVEIRGPVVYFDYCKMLDEYTGETSINPMMAIMIGQVELVKNPSLLGCQPLPAKKSLEPRYEQCKKAGMDFMNALEKENDERMTRYSAFQTVLLSPQN